jgi:uncharacterized membrane protein YphA (DoxX/SURF4 family)
MLSIFPELFTFSVVGVTLLRWTLAIVIIYIGLMTTGIKKSSYSTEMKVRNYPLSNVIPMVFGVVEIITGLFLLAGFLTQIIVLIAAYIFFNLIFIEKYVGRVFDYPNIFYYAMIMVSFSILFLGPGIFAVDLPL